MSGEMMNFPDTAEEFMEQYKIVDSEEVYTNGAELVPIFRMKQWFEHEKTQLSPQGTTSDLISRQAAIDTVNSRKTAEQCKEGEVRNWTVDACVDMIKQLPSAQPDIIRCKDCKYYIGHRCCTMNVLAIWRENDDFCSEAERKTE